MFGFFFFGEMNELMLDLQYQASINFKENSTELKHKLSYRVADT